MSLELPNLMDLTETPRVMFAAVLGNFITSMAFLYLMISVRRFLHGRKVN